MQKANKYISIFLLAIFTWVLLPGHLVHDVFANHHDTDHEEECNVSHRHLGVHIENPHVHCDIFKTNTPLYDKPEVASFPKPVYKLLVELDTKVQNTYFSSFQIALPARAPPVAAYYC